VRNKPRLTPPRFDSMTELAQPMTPALARRLCGRPLVLLLDVDGTLSPIAPRPEYAIVPPETQQLLGELAALPFTSVVVISGRAADDARRLVGVEGLWVIGNHGFEIAPPNQPPAVRSEVAPFAGRIASAAARCNAIAARIPGVVVEDKRWTVSVHYRLAHPSAIAALAAEIADVGRDLGLRVTRGKEVLELRPPIAIDKGTAATELAASLNALASGASLLCAGDDRTDEDAFRALRAAQPACVTIHVGIDPVGFETNAEFYVPDTAAMGELLQAVLLLQRRGAAN
jgi:trehalose-phosphatase